MDAMRLLFGGEHLQRWLSSTFYQSEGNRNEGYGFEVYAMRSAVAIGR